MSWRLEKGLSVTDVSQCGWNCGENREFYSAQVEVANFRGCEVGGVQLPQSCPVHTSPNLKVLQNFNYFAFICFWNVIE